MQNNQYSILQVGQIIAGNGSIESIKDIVKGYKSSSALILTDKGVFAAGLLSRPLEILKSLNINVKVIDNIPPEPATNDVNAIYDAAKDFSADLIIAIGGGSVMDMAKIIAVLMTNKLSLKDMLKGAEIPSKGLPVLMVPTTAGTGSEVTQNAIVLVPEDELKVGIVNSKLLADKVIIDPDLTMKLPPAITASTGMDALAHAIECYISKKANPFSDMYALEAIKLIYRSLRKAFNDGGDKNARHDMLLGALFGGMCIATSSTTAVHALAYPLGGKYHIAHGLSNAILLPYVMEFNLDAVEDRFKDIAGAMGFDVNNMSKTEAAKKMVDGLFSLIADLNINTSLKDKGIDANDIDILVESASKVTRLLDNNPKMMTKDDIRKIYQRLF